MESKRNLTCIVCPRGCLLTVTLKDGNPTLIEGNLCPRGKTYAVAECTNPVRTLTTTVRLADGRVLPVKTNNPIPKDMLFAAMAEINALRPAAPIKAGEILIENLLETGVCVIATADSE